MSDEVADRFARLMAGFDTAMTVVTTAHAGEHAGCLVGFQAQCSIDPPRYAIWLSKANHTYRVGLHAPVFAVHQLTVDDTDIAELFGTTTGDEVDKFERCAWTEHESGVRLLDACPDRFVARRTALLEEASDHVCVIVEPFDISTTGTLRPLRLSDVVDLQPGHEAEERPVPAEERAAPPGSDR